jgi:serine/threonine protein kinase
MRRAAQKRQQFVPLSRMSSPLNPGKRVGRYEIVSRIGVGGMGEVYLAQDTSLHRKVALKVLPVDVASESGSDAQV